MVRVNIHLPNGDEVTGRIDPTSSSKALKKFLIDHYRLGGNADDYYIVIIPKTDARALSIGVSEGDTIKIVSKSDTQQPFYPDKV